MSRVSPLEENAAIRYLWARSRIALLSDYNRLDAADDRVKEVTDLGLAYNLLTDYTSFIAIDTEIRAQGEKPVTIRQPLPLPSGVSDLAVGRGAQEDGQELGPSLSFVPERPRNACGRILEGFGWGGRIRNSKG